METINAYPTLNIERYRLKQADLRVKGQNLYVIVEREHNYYDDSDTNFLYYDADEDCLKTGQWTTRGYCGDMYYDYPCITAASEEVKAKALASLRTYAKSEVVPESLTEAWWKSLNIEEYGIPCIVEGGRKYQGEGILVKSYKKETYYGVSESVSVWTGERMEFVNPKFVKIDAELVFDNIFEMFDNMTFEQMNEYINKVYDNRWDKPSETALGMVCPIVSTNRPTLADKRSSLREWVAEKFCDKSHEEQERITHCVMMKKYGRDIYE